MTLNVSPRLESRIRAKLDTGEFADVEHLLIEALDRLDGKSDECETLEEFHAALDEAIAQANRGETYSEAEARAYLAARSAERLRG